MNKVRYRTKFLPASGEGDNLEAADYLPDMSGFVKDADPEKNDKPIYHGQEPCQIHIDFPQTQGRRFLIFLYF